MQAVKADALVQPAPGGGLARILHGGGGAETRILCGFLGSGAADDAVIASLPRVLKIGVAEGISGGWIESTFRFAAPELGAGGAQSAAVVGTLAEPLFMESRKAPGRAG